jgi:molecular chaperone GrpE
MENDDDLQLDTDGEEERGGSEDELEATEALSSNKIAKLRKELDQAHKEKTENLDGWQRAKADYVNALKRFEEEKKSALQMGAIKAASAFLPVMDSLARAQETMGGKNLPEGFEGILKQLESATRTLGLEPFGEEGEVFIPLLHEALSQIPTNDKSKDDTIVAVLEKGWKANDYVIRPAKVTVAHFEGSSA